MKLIYGKLITFKYSNQLIIGIPEITQQLETVQPVPMNALTASIVKFLKDLCNQFYRFGANYVVVQAFTKGIPNFFEDNFGIKFEKQYHMVDRLAQDVFNNGGQVSDMKLTNFADTFNQIQDKIYKFHEQRLETSQTNLETDYFVNDPTWQQYYLNQEISFSIGHGFEQIMKTQNQVRKLECKYQIKSGDICQNSTLIEMSSFGYGKIRKSRTDSKEFIKDKVMQIESNFIHARNIDKYLKNLEIILNLNGETYYRMCLWGAPTKNLVMTSS